MSGVRYLLDTNVVIGFLGGVDWAARFIRDALSENARLFVSTITRMKLLGFPGITPSEENKIKEFLSAIETVRLTAEIEDAAILI